MKYLKRARLIAMLPLMFLIGVAGIYLLGPFGVWLETWEEFKYRWHGGYGG